MAGGGLQAQPLSNHGQFNWIFLIWILVDGILAVFFLFYFNRLFAAVVSYAIRSYTWYKFRAYIDISALQISLLGGRVFFKSIRYHAHNLTVYVYDGHVTWRYWLPRVQAAEVFQHPHVATSATPRASSTAASEGDGGKSRADGPRARSSSIGQEEKGGVKPKTHLLCRISAKVTGVEAFIYNRSPLYDAVVDATTRKAREASKEDRGGSQSSSGQGSNSQRESKLGDEPQKLPTRTTAADAAAPEKSQIPAFLRIFPIKIECKRAAAALGNENTTNVLTAKAERAVGTVDAGHAGPLDLWKLLFDFSIEKVKVAMRPNKDFKEFQLRAGQRLLQEKELAPPEPEMKPVKEAVEKTRGVWFRLRRFFHRHSSSTDSLRTASIKLAAVGRTPREQPAVQSPWNGLARYLDERDLNEHEEWQNVEYAKVSDLVDCDKVTMRFYWDMSGPLPNGMLDSDTLLGSEYEDDINGTAPPEYGMDLGVYGGVVQYGPWADRQRINLQQIFFPAPYVDAVPAQPLQPGELRVCTVFKIKVVVEEDVILRVPTREESKDSQWKGRAEKAQPAHVHGNDANRTGRHWRKHRPGKRKNKKAQAAIDARPFGWLDVTVKKDSVVNYIMDMFPRSTGYRNNLDIDVKGVEMQSSVNHGLLWRSGPVSVQADISQPIEWNTLRKWPFQIVINDLELFILRDHLFLIIDLVNDWSSGAPSEFWNFVPYNYQLDMTFRNFVMYLNVNDANIINDPADFDRNDFLTLEGQLHAVLGIPMEYYRPKSNTITFDVLAQDLSMRQCSPPKSTFSVYVEDKTMAILPKLSLTGSYAANQEAKVGNVDVLRMDIVGTGLSLKAFGFYVRQLVSVQENYFGDYMHFKTLEEFQAAGDDLEEANAKTASFPKPTSINELDVILCIVAEEATVMFPTNLYSCKEFVRAELPRADLDLRIASYYLDMGLQLSPLSFMTGVTTTDEEDEGDPVDTESSTQFWVAHVDLNGHRAFGLPPNEDAYVSQWDIDIGKITGEMSSKFVRDLALAGRAFAFSIQDAENALPVRSPAVALDASFVQVRTDNVRLWMHVGKDALLMDLDPVTVDVCDWASSWFSQRVNVLVPLITFACVDGRSASRHRSPFVEKKPVRTHAFLQTGLSLDVVGRKLNFGLETKRQQAHLKLHDRRTGRFPFLIRTNIDAPVNPEDGLPFEAPAMPYPPMPAPLAYDGKRALSVRSSSTTLSRMQSPYESSRSSLAGSIRNGRPLSTAPQRPAIHQQPSEKSGSRPSTAFDMAGASSRSSSTDAPLPDRGDEILPNDAERAKSERPASTMAFSSLYSEPYFPLELTIPDETNVPGLPRVMDDPDEGSVTSTISQYIDNPDFDRNAERVTVLIKVIPGIRAYVEPHMAVTVANLIEKVLPRSAEEVMDSFQMSVMGAIAAHNAERIGPNKVLEINASLAQGHIRVVALEEHKDEIADQIDVALGRLEVSVRVRTEPRDEGALQLLALHTLLGNLDLSVSQRSGQEPAAPAVSMHVDDVLVWLALTSTRAFHLSFRDTALAVDGPQTRYLTVLALKLIPLITGIVDRFDGIFANNTRRLQWLTYVLTQNGEAVGDPPFMARMLYILRAFPGHFRNTDSWKIFSRLRHILLNLPEKKSDELEAHCRGKSFEFPADAPTKTLESWTEWRNWDVPYVNQTMAFTVLWHSDEPKHEPPSEKPPLTVTFRSESFRISIENGKTRSEVFLEETSLEVENIPPTRPEGLMLVDENTRTKTLIQLHIGTIALNLDWSLVSIAEDVVALNDKIQQASSHLQASGKRTTRQAIDDGLARHDVHIVLSTDAGSISLESINVRHISQAEGLKVSIIGTTRASEQLGQCASVIVNVDRAVTELHGAKSRICQTLLISPSLYVDRVQPASGADIPATVTLALAYEDLQIRITEQLPGIIHLVDSIIVDEVSKCQALAEAVKPRPSSSASASPVLTPQKTKNTIASETTTGSVPPKLHVAVLARNVHLEVSLLQNLGFVLEGVAASVRVAPSLANDKMFGLDFDIGQQKHAFVNTSEDERHIQGLLDVPPINGHVGLELSHDETSVSITTTIEKVEVDAGAIQGVIGVVNRPEVQEVFKSIKAGIEDIQHHVHEVFPKRGVDKPKPVKEQRITFDARVALLGIRVSAETPTARDAHRYRATAEVEFGIGPFHVTASNRDTSKDANPLIPEVRAYIQDLGAALRVRERGRMRPCGNATMSIRLHFNNTISDGETVHRELKVQSDGIEINANPETASTVVDVINHLDDRIRHLDLSKEVEYLRRLRDERRQTVIKRIKGKEGWTDDDEMPFSPEDLLSITTTIELTDIQASWLVDQSFAAGRGAPVEDLVFSIASIEFQTRGGHEARLNIQNIQLQLAQREESKQRRALNSALLPEVGFSVAYWSEKGKNIQLAFKATGKPLDLRLESTFILAVSAVQRSIELARDRFKNGTATWQSTPTASGAPRRPGFDTKRLSAVRMEADFAGAQVHIHGSGPQSNSLASIAAASQQHGTQHGAYGQFAADGALMQTTLTAPGIALKVEYNRDELQPRLNGELMIDASSNMLAPNVAPLVLEISNSVKEVMRSQEKEKAKPKPKPPPPATSESTGDGRPGSDHPRTKPFFEDDNIVATTPARIFGKTKVDLGFRIAKQEFGLSCQPIARVDAKASLEDFYITMNTIDSDEHGHFFAMSAVMTKLTAQVKHMYSREPTFSYDMDSIVLSAMNNKHLSGTAGISAILNVNPTKLVINGKQFQDLLLFREIWLPPEIRRAGAAAPAQTPASGATLQRPDEFVVQRYQTLAAAAAFPWNATVNIAELAVDVDLGQSIGKSSFTMTNLWASQQKWSNWEQNLCVGLNEMGVNSTGRMSGFIHLGGLGVRTSIKWPEECAEATLRKTPLIQASVGFKELRAKAAFDYQAFAFSDIGDFDFLMYNVRDQHGQADRLVAVVDCEKAYVFCTSSSASQAVALYQAFDRLIQEKQTAYMQSLREIEKHLRRESTVAPTKFGPTMPHPRVVQKKAEGSPISLHTDVVVTMGAICLGVYPSTFFDSQMLKLEASNIQARFAVGLERGKITSGLGMTLGQLQVALASARRTTAVPQALEIGVDEVIASALNAKGGIILRVPKVVASMQTWQPPKGYDVDFTFKSVFDGKIDVGWNLSRINSIKGMWESGTRALASRLDKSLPQSAVKIKAAGPAADSPSSPSRRGDQQDGSPPPPPAAAAAPQEKITAEINLPQSRYEYHALEPPVIETPQLRDMGEATPPLEWVGLHRDRLPNVTHQIIIVTLLEVCREVEDAYTRILGGAVREAAS